VESARARSQKARASRQHSMQERNTPIWLWQHITPDKAAVNGRRCQCYVDKRRSCRCLVYRLELFRRRDLHTTAHGTQQTQKSRVWFRKGSLWSIWSRWWYLSECLKGEDMARKGPPSAVCWGASQRNNRLVPVWRRSKNNIGMWVWRMGSLFRQKVPKKLESSKKILIFWSHRLVARESLVEKIV